MFIEALETRRLMSSTISASLGGDGTLYVEGTAGADTVDIIERSGMVSVVANGNADHPLFFGRVKGVRIALGAGADQVSYFGDSLCPSIDLGDGNDYLQIGMTGNAKASVFGGKGDDIVVASGNVLFYGGTGNNTLVRT